MLDPTKKQKESMAELVVNKGESFTVVLANKGMWVGKEVSPARKRSLNPS